MTTQKTVKTGTMMRYFNHQFVKGVRVTGTLETQVWPVDPNAKYWLIRGDKAWMTPVRISRAYIMDYVQWDGEAYEPLIENYANFFNEDGYLTTDDANDGYLTDDDF